MSEDEIVYIIRDWERTFERAQSRKSATLSWVAMPNKHDGKGYRRLSRLPDGVDLFCAFILIVEVASKMPRRGILKDEDGPLSPEDLSDMTGFPEAIFAKAFQTLTNSKIGWLTQCNTSELPAEHHHTPLTGEERRGDKNTYTCEFESFWKAYPRKIAKAHAYPVFQRVVKQGLVDESALIAAAIRYREASKGTELRYVKHPKTWLNGGCWEDDYTADATKVMRYRDMTNGMWMAHSFTPPVENTERYELREYHSGPTLQNNLRA